MNKKWGKCLLIIIFLLAMLLPINSKAKLKSSSSKAICNNQVGIEINPGVYSRNAGFSNGSYTNSVADRKVTITVKHPKKYFYRMIKYEGKIGELENLNTLEEDEVDNQPNINRTVKRLTEKTTEEIIKPGYEVIIIVLLRDSEGGTGNDNNQITVKNDDKTGKCKVGRLDKTASEAYDITVKGTAADAFVQNTDALSIPNLRARTKNTGTACQNAYKGFNTENPAFTISDPATLDIWRRDYYSRILKYCEARDVPFNLEEDDITKISNKLLEMFYKIRTGNANNTTSSNIMNKINNELVPNVNDYYILERTYDSDGAVTEKGTGNQNVRTTMLSCEYDKEALEYDSSNKLLKYKNGFGQKQYLYAETSSKFVQLKKYKKKTNKKELTNPIKVCDTACYEHLTVVYSPPQVTKAGLCFQYRVTIKSNTECGVTYNTDRLLEKLENELNKREMCSPMPVCQGDETKTQAGPSQEFDNCINSCDNGKYSQKCINQCYEKVYGDNTNKKTKNVKKTSNKFVDLVTDIVPSTMIKDNTNINLVTKLNVKDSILDYSETNYQNYYKNKICSNDDIYSNEKFTDNLSKCAKYYFRAKTLYPMGEYDCPTGKNCTWESYEGITGPVGINSANIEEVGMQIGRASPFYTRTEEATKDLIKGFFIANGRTNRKYYISKDGIKTQASKGGTWHCPMKCSYSGCSEDNSLTSSDYSDLLNNNLASINDALNDCKAKAECGEEKTTDFEVSVDRDGKSDKTTQTSTGYTQTVGDNQAHSTSGVTNGVCSDGRLSMFIPAFSGDTSSNGIFGQCYNGVDHDANGQPIQYQTTITFPGSWINLKTGEVSYECKTTGYRQKTQYYCTSYDENNKHSRWWNWVVNGNTNPNYYPEGFNPSTDGWNIKAKLGKDINLGNDHGFGKYGWHIGFQCFYASYDKPTPCTGDCCDNNCDLKNYCYRGDPGKKEECTIVDDDSTKLNYDIRVVSLDSMFPNNRLRGFNWGSSAKLSAEEGSEMAKQLSANGYDVDPVAYSKEIIKNQGGIGEEGTYKDSNLDFRIVLDSKDNDIQYLKRLTLDFGGTFDTTKEIIPGLYAYNMLGNSNMPNIQSKIVVNKLRNNRGKNNIK